MKNDITGSVATVIKAPLEKVWDALVNPEMIKQYLFGTNTISEWKQGSSIVFEGEWEGNAYQDKGTIRQIEAQEILQYDYWSSMSKVEDKPENYMLLTFKLNQDDNGHVLLTLLHENIATEEARAHAVQNWQMVLGKMKSILEQSKHE